MEHDHAARRPKDDLTGRRHGKVTVIRFHEYRGTLAYWWGVCDCGTEKPFAAAHLKDGRTKSCGCGRNGVRIDLTGQRFGKFLVARLHEVRNGRAFWWCVCDCGVEKESRGDALTDGRTVSCGCHSRFQNGHVSDTKTHGMKGTPEHHTWINVKGRCQNENDNGYDDYGKRGIYICERWDESFEAFYADMGARPVGDYSIDRVDNSGSYTCGKHDACADCREKNAPFNCRWATRIEQMQNTRFNRNITAFGETHCVSEWARRLNMDAQVLFSRLNRGIPFEEAIVRPTARWRILDENAVREMRSRAASGESHDEIAGSYGLSRKYFQEIISRRSWPNVV